MKRTISLARSSSFIPETMIKLVKKNNDDFLDKSNLNFKSKKSAIDLTDKVDKYNRFLGGLAFMRLGGKNFMNYSKNYFTTLDYFNTKIKQEVSTPKQELNLESTYHGLFIPNNTDWKKWQNYIFGDYQNIISEIKDKVPYKNNLYQQDNVINNKQNYVLSILANYGPEQFKAKTIDSLVMAIVSDKIEYREAITLFFGLHNGYRDFRQSYYLNNATQIIKFELNSKLDYYIIESIYQFVFNNKITDDFPYLEIVAPENTKIVDTKKYQTYRILDEYIIYDIKPDSIKEIIAKFFRRTRFKKVLSALSFDFSKNYEIELTIEQTKKIESKYFSIIEQPIRDYLKGLEEQISEFNNKKVTELELQLNKFKKEYNQLSLLLKKSDKTLFDEIDTNGDGELSQSEIGIFMDKIIEAKKQLELEKSQKPIKKETKSTGVKYIPENRPVLQAQEQPEEYISENNLINTHKYYLSKLGINEIKKIAKKHQLYIPKNLKAQEKEKVQLLINRIIESIQSNDKLSL